MSTTVDIRGIVKAYGAGAPAVGGIGRTGVSLRIEPGELFFLLGPSGCGKTTLLRMIAGFTEPTSGSIWFKTGAGVEREVTHLAANQRNTGMVFQSYALWPHMTIAANVAFGLEVRKVGRAERQARVDEALRMVQMEAYAQRKPNQLSGGQQQRVALARALVVRPDVLLLDEPLSNLDAKLRVELRAEIRRICKASGITTIYVTHDQKEALSMADRIAIMRDGAVAQLGRPAELYRRPSSKFVCEFLGETNFLPVSAVQGTRVTTPAGDLETAAGPGRSTLDPVRALADGGGGLGGAMSVSIRPEALQVVANGGQGDGPNTLSGRIIETTYLGELAHHVVELKPRGPGPGVRIKVAVLNPGGLNGAGVAGGPGADGSGQEIALRVAPADVVIV